MANRLLIALFCALFLFSIPGRARNDKRQLVDAKYLLEKLDSSPVVSKNQFRQFPGLKDELDGNLAGAYTAEIKGDIAIITWQMFQATQVGVYPIAVSYNISTGKLVEIDRVVADLGMGVANGKVSFEDGYVVVSRNRVDTTQFYPPGVPRPLKRQIFELAFYQFSPSGVFVQTPVVVPFDQLAQNGELIYDETASYQNVVGYHNGYLYITYGTTDVPVPSFLERFAQYTGIINALPIPDEQKPALIQLATLASPTNYINTVYLDVVRVGPNFELSSALRTTLPDVSVAPIVVIPGLLEFKYLPYTQNAVAYAMQPGSKPHIITVTASVNSFCISNPLGAEARVATWQIDLLALTVQLTGLTPMPQFIEDHDVDKVNDMVYVGMHKVQPTVDPNSLDDVSLPYANNAADQSSELQSIKINTDGSHTLVDGYRLNAFVSQVRCSNGGELVAVVTTPYLANNVFQLPPETSPLGDPSRTPSNGDLKLFSTANLKIRPQGTGGATAGLTFGLAFSDTDGIILHAGIPSYKEHPRLSGGVVSVGADGATILKVTKNGMDM